MLNLKLAVKPIIGNREIEKVGESTFVKNQLPFPSWVLEDAVYHVDS